MANQPTENLPQPTEPETFRFRWRKREGWGVEAYDAFLDAFRVAQIIHDPGASGRLAHPYRWMVSCFVMHGQSEPKGSSATPREAARAAESAFDANLPKVYGFYMRTERAIEFCRVLGIDLPTQTRLQAKRFGLI